MTFHHSKGSPDDNLMGQGKYGYLTWWEQLDNGKQFTWEKKILTIAPILLYVRLHGRPPEQLMLTNVD